MLLAIGPRGIRVNSVNPAAVKTDMFDKPDGPGGSTEKKQAVSEDTEILKYAWSIAEMYNIPFLFEFIIFVITTFTYQGQFSLLVPGLVLPCHPYGSYRRSGGSSSPCGIHGHHGSQLPQRNQLSHRRIIL